MRPDQLREHIGAPLQKMWNERCWLLTFPFLTSRDLNNPCVAEGTAMIGGVSVGEVAGFKLHLRGFEQGVVEQGISREGGAIGIHEINDFGQMRSHTAS